MNGNRSLHYILSYSRISPINPFKPSGSPTYSIATQSCTGSLLKYPWLSKCSKLHSGARNDQVFDLVCSRVRDSVTNINGLRSTENTAPNRAHDQIFIIVWQLRSWREQPSGIWHRVDVVLTDVSEERIASIFRVEGRIRKSTSEET
jgi:hypothetical protein